METVTGICPEAEDGVHEGELDYTSHVYGTYRQVRVENNVIVIDTVNRKEWDSDEDLQGLQCNLCGEKIDWADERYEVVWE